MRRIRNKEILINLILLVVAVILFLICFELVLKFIFPQKLYTFQFDENLIYKLAPNIDVTHSYKNEFKARFTTNSRGIVGNEEYPYEKDKNKYRIIMLGDSFIESKQVENYEKANWIIECDLRKKGFNADVINMGTSGYGTDQELYYLTSEGLKYKPDAVILNIFLGNDIADNIKDDVYRLERGELTKNKVKIATYRKIWAFLRRNFHSVTFFSENFIKPIVYKNKRISKEVPHRFLNNYTDEKGWEKTKELIREMKKVVKESNSTFLVVIIPEKEQLSLEIFQTRYEVREWNKINMTKYQTILKEFLESENIEYVDMLLVLNKLNKNKDKNYFYFEQDSHFNIEGNKILAEAIKEWIREKELSQRNRI